MRSIHKYILLLILDKTSSNEFVNCIANCNILDRFAADTLTPEYNSLLILLDISLTTASKFIASTFFITICVSLIFCSAVLTIDCIISVSSFNIPFMFLVSSVGSVNLRIISPYLISLSA